MRENGIGIDPQFHDKVFRIFEKLDPVPDGTGLDLVHAKRVIESHGGRIWVESDGAGNGSTFLPYARRAAAGRRAGELARSVGWRPMPTTAGRPTL